MDQAHLFTNRMEQVALIAVMILFGLLIGSDALAAGTTGSRVGSGVGAGLFLLAASYFYNRPSISIAQECVVLRSQVVKRRFPLHQLASASVEVRRIGAFRRSVLVLWMNDGSCCDLGSKGIWAAVGSDAASDLRSAAAVISRHAKDR